MMWNRRNFLIRSGCCLAAVSAIINAGTSAFGIQAWADHGALDSGEMESMLLELFGTSRHADDASLRIDLPVEAINPEFVPFRVVAPDSDRIAIFIEESKYPLLLLSEEGHRAYREITGIMRAEGGQHFTVYALRNGNLHGNTRTIRRSRPQDRMQWPNRAVAQPPPSTILRAEASRDGINILCSIRHQQGNLLGMTPHVRQVIFSVNDQIASTLECGPRVARNPRFGIHLKSLHEDDVIQVDWNDSAGTEGSALGTVGLILNRNLYREI